MGAVLSLFEGGGPPKSILGKTQEEVKKQRRKTKLSIPYSQHVFQFSFNPLAVELRGQAFILFVPSCTMMTYVFLEYLVHHSEARSISNDESEQERI